MGAFRIPYSTGMMGVSLTRAYLEHSLRRRVGALPNAVLRDNAAVTQVVGVPGRVTGVQLDDGEVIEADLVVDATGRSDRGDRWLEQVGCQAPRSTRSRSTSAIRAGCSTGPRRPPHRDGRTALPDGLDRAERQARGGGVRGRGRPLDHHPRRLAPLLRADRPGRLRRLRGRAAHLPHEGPARAVRAGGPRQRPALHVPELAQTLLRAPAPPRPDTSPSATPCAASTRCTARA
ncbi:NAD(P)/FAD-dependent oxidoreductase [Streptomyces zhihengii]